MEVVDGVLQDTANTEILKHLASFSENNEDGRTPLFVALKYGKCNDTVREILKCNPDLNVKDRFGEPILLAALETNSISSDVILELINRGASCIDSDFRGYTPLHVALKNNRSAKVIKEILKQGVDVTAKNINGETPFFYASEAMTANLKVLKELFLNEPSVVNIKDNSNRTSLQEITNSLINFVIMNEIIKHGEVVNANDAHSGMSDFIDKISIETKEYFVEFMNAGASINERFDINIFYNMDPTLINELVKYALIQHPSDIPCEYCEKLKFRFEKSMSTYIEELERMKGEYVFKNFTLFDFVIKRFDYGKEFSEKTDVVRQVNFSKDLKMKFPMYHNIILTRLETRAYYLKYFFDSKVFVETGDRVIYLNTYCLSNIGKFLSKQDLKNAVFAFSIHNS